MARVGIGNTQVQAKSGIPVYVIAANPLAGKYLVNILADHRDIRPRFCERLPQPRLGGGSPVFVLEVSYIPLPLSKCLDRLRNLFPGTRVVLVSQPLPDAELIRLLTLGISGFVEHSKVGEALSHAVSAVVSGQLWIPEDVLRGYIELTSTNKEFNCDVPRMPTPREAEVLELARQRKSNKEIAQLLRIEEGTVKYHMSKLFTKLRVDGRHELEIKAAASRIWEELSS